MFVPVHLSVCQLKEAAGVCSSSPVSLSAAVLVSAVGQSWSAVKTMTGPVHSSAVTSSVWGLQSQR